MKWSIKILQILCDIPNETNYYFAYDLRKDKMINFHYRIWSQDWRQTRLKITVLELQQMSQNVYAITLSTRLRIFLQTKSDKRHIKHTVIVRNRKLILLNEQFLNMFIYIAGFCKSGSYSLYEKDVLDVS